VVTARQQAQAAAAARSTAAAVPAARPQSPGSTAAPTTPAPRPTDGNDANTGNSDSGDSPATTTAKKADPPSVDVPATSPGAATAVRAALSQLGVSYRFAAASPGVAFDCSGLTMWAWAQAGVSLPHFAVAQYAMLPHVSRDNLQPGDLVFFYSDLHHVGIYIGNGQFVHAPRTGDVVKISPLAGRNFVGAARP
jgi:cell wall-associated NlpC family hydrolase